VVSRASALKRELAALLGPLGSGARWSVERLHWWLIALMVVYAGSGVTMVQPDEVAVVYRLGALVGEGAGAVHPPGLLLALPRPLDRVERIPVAKVFETELLDLHFTQSDSKVTRYLVTNRASLDPERTGYALTGDQNIVHMALVARWQVSDPLARIRVVSDPESQLRAAVLSATVRELGSGSVDTVLSDGRQAMVDAISRSAQGWLDDHGVGVSIVSLELGDLAPPQQVQEAFRDVQTAAIDAETRIRSANEYREVQLPKARTDKRRAIQAAESEALGLIQQATSEASAFEALVVEYHKDREVVRQRLYREGIEKVLSDAGKVDFLPPPARSGAAGSRLTIPLDARTRRGKRDE
jgi:membrane protease subunit HflK